MFVHLRAHSWFSFLRGLASPQQLVQAAAGHNLPALALTDHHSLTGAIEFYDACQRAGIQPILGLEVETIFPQIGDSHISGALNLLSTGLDGWRSLCRIASALDGGEAPLPWPRLAQESAGLLCLTGGLRGPLAPALHQEKQAAQALLGQLAEVYPNSLYVELQQHTPGDAALAAGWAGLAHRGQIPIVASHDIHYIDPGQAHMQRLVSAIRRIQLLSDLPAEAAAPENASFTSPTEMEQRFSAYPAALAACAEIAERCKYSLPLDQPHFPNIELPSGQSALEVLRRKAEAGAQRLYGELTPEIQARLVHELDIIEQTGFAVLFLVVEDILEHARLQGVPTASRGSASSSLVAHCLGITTPDPLRHNLYFERFLNPARSTPPDIDTDLCSRRREQVIRYVYRRFGEDHVATVGTINRFRSRSALRETAKAHGLPLSEVSRLADSLPHHWYGPPNRRSGDNDPYAELREQNTTPLHQAIFRDAAALIGTPHHLSVHPGGIVIAPGPLIDLAPTQMAAKGVTITQFDLDSIERLGLVKIDLLGIRGLTVLGDVAAQVVERQEAKVLGSTKARPGQAALDFLETIPAEDPQVSEMLLHGRTIGCFQIESPGMRATLREVRAGSVEDILVALALYRPGPLSGGLKDAFVRRLLGQEETVYLHPALQPLLAETYGVILYQEQVLRIAHELAGLSLADADLLRRAMSHFDPGKQMQTLKEKFIAGAWEHSQAPQAVAERTWELMAAFAGYGFPKAHAASYAQVAWRAAWCKLHHPAIFMASVLANWGGYYSQRVYLNEARRMGLALRAPHINHARRDFSIQYLQGQPVLFMGLDQVRDLTRQTMARIIKERPFTSLHDFLARVDPRPVEVENLAKVGALEGFGSIPAILEQIRSGGWRGGQLSFLVLQEQQAADWPLAEKVAAQEQLLGVSVIAHPLDMAAEQIRAAGAVSTVEAAGRLGQSVRVAGMRQTWRRTSTTRGDHLYFMSLEDLEGMLEVIIYSEVYQRSRSALTGPGPYIIEGVVELDFQQGEPFLRAERISPLPGRAAKA